MNRSQYIKKIPRFLTYLVLLTALFAAGCGAVTGEPSPPTSAARQPFSARSESEGGAVIAWSGYTDGYQPGEETSFEIMIKNDTEQSWRGRFCLQLMAQDTASVVATLAQQEIDLEPGMGFSDTLTVQMPQTLDPGGYGLSTVVRRPAGPMVDLLPIQVGGSTEMRRAATQEDMEAALEACPPVEDEGPQTQVEAAKSDLAQRVDATPNQITVKNVEEKQFSDASLGVPEPGQTYAQVITPGYVIQLEVNGTTYRYHASEQRVVLVPQEPTQTPPPTATESDTSGMTIPEDGAMTTLPLHFLIYVDQPEQEYRVTLRWGDNTELSDTFTALAGPDGGGLLLDSIDWQTEGQPPQPGTDQAVLVVNDSEGETVVERQLTILSGDHPQTRSIDLYWLLGEELESEQRRVVDRDDIERAAVEELLWGPPPRNLAGFLTALPTPEEVLAYPGRQPSWGVRVKLLDLSIEEGTATVNFSEEIRAYGGGSARVQSIRDQVTRTLTQFSTVDEVVIAVAGETEGVLQP